MRFFVFAVFAVFALAAPHQARADYAVWQDPGTGLSLSWPDTWKIVSNADPDDLVTVMAPSGRAHASCRVRARDDARYLIFPPDHSWAVQQVAYGAGFWPSYLAEYDNARVLGAWDGAGLGRGFAGYALAGYESAVQGPYMSRRALIFASLYNGTAYFLECSAHEDAFDNWKDLFLSIAGSVDFRKAHQELRTGHFPAPNFLKDPRIEFRGDQGENRIVY